MERTILGNSDVEVSTVCLGTMTFGHQTSPEDAFAQMDLALDSGISFFDCAEIYPVNPVRAETVGDSERVIGAWLARSGKRDRVQIATKVAGLNQVARGGEGYDGPGIALRVDESLARLGVDRIDLYQLHTPMRPAYHFRKIWTYDPSGQDRAAILAHMDEVMAALAAQVRAGKLRSIGLSNETAWGTARWADAAARHGVAISTIQNEYSLLARLWDSDMAEAAALEGLTLLAYSPLAAGALTAKYAGGARPAGSRAAVDMAFGGEGTLNGRLTDRAEVAIAAYHAIAARHGLDPVAMAIAFLRDRPVPTIPIIGATTETQLRSILAGLDLRLSQDVLDDIAAAYRSHPQPY